MDCIVHSLSFILSPCNVRYVYTAMLVSQLWYHSTAAACQGVCLALFGNCVNLFLNLVTEQGDEGTCGRVNWLSSLRHLLRNCVVCDAKGVTTGPSGEYPIFHVVLPVGVWNAAVPKTESLQNVVVPIYPVEIRIRASALFPLQQRLVVKVTVTQGVLRPGTPLFAITSDGSPLEVGIVQQVFQHKKRVPSVCYGFDLRNRRALVHLVPFPGHAPTRQVLCEEQCRLLSIMDSNSVRVLRQYFPHYLMSNREHVLLISQILSFELGSELLH
jgi:hypothetical protein